MKLMWLAECDAAPNRYAGKYPRFPITSLISQARKTSDHEKCKAWCDRNPGYTPKLIPVPDEDE